MSKILHLGCILFVLLLFSGSLLAQSEEEGTDTEVALPELDVRGTIRREELQSTSAVVLENKDVNGRIYYQPLDIIKQSPGVFVDFYGESGIAPPFSIRGFSAGHGGANIIMYLDGIPLHDNGHATGYLDTGIIMPIEIESVEIIKGPASVYYGQHAAGGAIPFQTIKGGNLTRMNLRYGSYNEMDAAGLIARDIGKLSQVYAFEIFHTDGYRSHSDWDKKNFSGRWTYRFSDAFSASLNLRAYQSQWDSAGYIAKMQSKSKNDWVNDGSGQGNGGKRNRYDGRLWLNYLINPESQLTFYLYGTTLEHTRWQISKDTLPNTAGSGSEQANKHKSWGSGLTYSYKGDLAGRAASATFGFTYSLEKEVPNNYYSLIWGQGRTRGGIDSSETFSLSTPSILGEIIYQILDPLQVRIGGRYDWLAGKYQDNLYGNSESVRYHFFSPKAGLLYTPLDWLQVYANFGRGFNSPGLMAWSGGMFAGDPLKLTSSDQYELGTKVSLNDWMDLDVAVFTIKTKNDISYDEQSNTTSSVGQTKRRGLEASLNLRPWTDWNFLANYSYIDARYDVNTSMDWSTWGYYDFSGRRLISLPRHTTNLELSYAPPQGLGGRLNFRWESDSLIRDLPAKDIAGTPSPKPATYKAQDKGTLDLQLNYRFNDNYKIALDVLNVMDKDYYAVQSVPNSYGDYAYSFRPPRTFYLTLEMNWDAK